MLDDAAPDSPLALDDVTDAVLAAVDGIPVGRVTSYGAVGKVASTTARRAGRAMRTHGHLTAWWRVVRADGTSPVGERARVHWDAEGIPYTVTRTREGARYRVDMRSAGLD
ncbi:MGMT family protein [Corynebacterium frankenforstense]